MNLGSLRALALELNVAAHGVDVLVTRSGEAGIDTRGIWLTTISEDMPIGSDFQRREPRRVMALRLADVGTVPKGTIIYGPEKDGDEDERRYWMVDGTERQEADHIRVYVVPIDEDEALG